MWGCRFCSAGERGGLRQAVRNLSDEIVRLRVHYECAKEAMTKMTESII